MDLVASPKNCLHDGGLKMTDNIKTIKRLQELINEELSDEIIESLPIIKLACGCGWYHQFRAEGRGLPIRVKCPNCKGELK